MPYCFMQSPNQNRIPYKDRIPPADDPLSSFRSGEIQAMNREFIEYEKLRAAGHNDR